MNDKTFNPRELLLVEKFGVRRRRESITSRGIDVGTRLKFGWMIFLVSFIHPDWYLDVTRTYSNGRNKTARHQNPLSYVVVTDPDEKDADGN